MIPTLESFACPKCQRSHNFYVDVLATVMVTANGTTLSGDYFADADLTCCCLDCQHEGRVSDFTRPS